jgi:hypothetical protein
VAVPAAAAGHQQDFSQEAVVIQQTLTRVRFEEDGSGTRETTARMKVQADAGVKQLAVLTFTYTSANQQVDIAYVRVLHPDGTVVVTPGYNVQDMPADVSREAPMYSDIHEKHVAVRGLGVGDTLEYKVTLRTLKAEDPGQFWMEYSFEKNAIMLDEQLDLDLPADKQVTVVSTEVQPTIATQGGRKVFHWSSTNLSRPDPDKPKSTKHWKPSVQVTTFSSWAQVGAWYDSLQKDRVQVTPVIQAKADALTKGLTNPDDKIRAIFNAVALHIHYVSLSFGIGRYQPHAADDVLANEYGDCKDKHTLLATLLKAVGIEAWPALIPSGRELDAAVPSPAQFDHVITVVPRDGKFIWMDSTAEVAPMGILFATLRDKQALVVPADKPAYLDRTAAVLPFPQAVHFDVEGQLSDKGEFTAHIEQSYYGDAEFLMRIAFRAVPESQWKQLAQYLSSASGFGGEVSNPVLSPLEQTDKPLQLSYDYKREKYGEWDDRRIGAAMPPVGWELAPGVKVVKPADDVDIGSPGEEDYVSNIRLPIGYSLMAAQGTHIEQPWAKFDSYYSVHDGVFRAERRLVFKKEYVPIADWDKYVAFRNAIYEDSARMMPIMGVASYPGLTPQQYDTLTLRTQHIQELADQLQPLRDSLAVLARGASPSADELAASLAACKQAVQAIEEKSSSLPPAQFDSLYSARVLAAAWTALGWLQLESKHLPEAHTYLQAAWTLSQDPFAGYLYGRTVAAEGKRAEAEHVFRLAYIGGYGSIVANLAPTTEPQKLIAAAYEKLASKPIDATALKNNQYEDSLRSELDKAIERHPLIPSTALNGQGYYAVAFQNGKAAKAYLLRGDKGMDSFLPRLERNPFSIALPPDSHARLLREIKLICTPYAGCDAYMMLPNAIKSPPITVKVVETKTPDGTKKVEKIQLQLPE